MNILTKQIILCFLIVALLAPASKVLASDQKPLIQLAIILDTSGSMDGLIDQAKSQLWKIVNEFIAAKKQGVRPEIQVALYEYGKQSIPSAEGYLRMILPLSTDLDKVSEELFALKTNGGDEYCGRVIQAATEGLGWSKSNDDLKVIVIAGNEPFTQGNVDYKQTCSAAIAKGIIVNTIFCGPHAEGVQTMWKHGAQLADGMYLNIDQNQQITHIESPQDAKIEELGNKLNTTYIAFGKAGHSSWGRQAEQDELAKDLAPGVMVERAICKSSGNYVNDSWDLIDACNAGNKLEEVPVKELPKEMQKMTLEERKAYVEKKAAERKAIQEQIQTLTAKRNRFVASKQTELAQSGKNSLDVAMIKMLRSQAGNKNYEWSSEKKVEEVKVEEIKKK